MALEDDCAEACACYVTSYLECYLVILVVRILHSVELPNKTRSAQFSMKASKMVSPGKLDTSL